MALSAIAFATSALAAQDSALPTVVVTATRSPQDLSQVLADVTVLTRADIERQAVGGVADLLRNQASFEMTRNGGPGATTSLYVRGADTRHTVVLIDGVRVDSQATGGASWSALPLAQIERIEIVRGAASAIYGSDAIGGVVQIFTRKGEGKPQLELGAGVGNLGLAKLDASLSGTNGMLDYAISVAGERSTGFNILAAAPDTDGYRNHSASLRLGAQVNAKNRVELLALQSHVWSQYDSSWTPTANDIGTNDTKSLRGNWSAQWTPAWHSEVSIGEATERYESTPSIYLTETRIRSYAWNNRLKVGPGKLDAMLERREDRLLNSGLSMTPMPGQGDRQQDAVAAGYQWSVGALSLQAHARHDSDSEFGGADTGMLAAGYKLAPAWRVLGSIGTAFRAPTLYQSFSDSGPNLSKGGLPLQPEHGRNAELGLQFNQAGTEFKITAYRNLVDQLIVYGAAGTCSSAYGCYHNVGEAQLQGVTLQAATQLGGIRVSGALDAQSPKDVTSASGYANYGKRLARRTAEHATLRADTNLAGWSLGAQTLISGMRYDNAANTVKLGGYAVLNLDAQRNLTPSLRLQVQLDNVFDRSYQTANGYASSPRGVFVGLRYTPKL